MTYRTGKILAVTIMATGFAISASATTFYAECGAATSGDGSAASPFNSLADAIDAAAPGDTIAVRGAIEVSDPSQRIIIPAEKEGIHIVPWGDGRLAVSAGATYAETAGANAPAIFSIGAANATVSGIDFTYGKNSLTYNNGKPHVRLIEIGATNITLSSCSVRNTAPGEIPYGAYNTAINCTNKTASAHLTVRGCRFDGIRGNREDTHYGVFCIADYMTVENCFFTNCWSVTGKDNSVGGRCLGFTFVSNIFFVATSKNAFYWQPSKYNYGLFHSSYDEIGSGEIAYNVLVGGGYGQSLFNYTHNMAFDRSTIKVHHNTATGFRYLFSGGSSDNNNYGNHKAKFEFFDNVFDVDTLFFEDTPRANPVTALKSGSFFRNNAFCSTNLTVLCDGLATTAETYDLFDNLTFTNNYPLSSPPVFISTEASSPDFYVPKSRLNPSWAAKRRALVETGGVRYPDFIGARMFQPVKGTLVTLQ